MAKKDQIDKMDRGGGKVVLGLRATPEERAWMVAMAKKHGMSLQAYFEDIMKQQSGSPWRRPDEKIVAIPEGMSELVRLLGRVYELKNELAINTVRRVLQSFINEIKATTPEGS